MKRNVFWATICLVVMMCMPSCSQNEGEVENKAEKDRLKIEKMERLLESYGAIPSPKYSKAQHDSILLAADYEETEKLLKALKQGFITVGGSFARVDSLENEKPQ